MPVDTPFLKKVLEGCLGHQVEVLLLFDFLEVVVRTPSQKRLLSTFIEKWKECLRKSVQKMMIVNYVGTWSPDCSTQQELRKQESWNEFACKFDKTFTHCTVDSQSSPDYQPLNFKELIRLTFWKEIYEKLGSKIVHHIFSKCALLFEVDEGLYLMVGHSQGIIHKKISNFERKIVKKVTGVATQVPNVINCQYNPYQLNRLKGSDEQVVTDKENSDSLKLNSLGHAALKARPGVLKRTNDNSVPGGKDIKKPPSKRIRLNNENEKTDNSDNCVPRWIRPKPEILQKLIEHRVSTMKSHNLIPTSAALNPSECTANILNYICIQKDEVFKMKDKRHVMKQKIKVLFNKPRLPQEWLGLKLPDTDTLRALADKDGRVEIIVHIISETLAAQMEIRIKPKGRQRRKNSQAMNSTTTTTVSSLNFDALSHGSTKRNSKPEAPTLLKEQRHIIQNKQNISNGTNSTQHIRAKGQNYNIQNLEQDKMIDSSRIKPYGLNILLPISSCLYNKSSWSKWPTNHCLSKAGLFLIMQDKVGCIKIVADDILESLVCSQNAHRHLMNSLQQNWLAGDDSNALNRIIVDIVQEHSKFKDIHKLFKNCVTYWRSKYFDKQEKKRKSGHNRNEAVVANRKRESRGKTSRNLDIEETKEKEPEVIDLTLDSPATQCPENATARTSVDEIDGVCESLPTACVPCSSKNVCKSLPTDLKSLKVKLTQRTRYELLRKSSGDSASKRSFKRLKNSIPPNCVMQSLKQIFHIMKVDQLLGSKRNVRGFFKFVRKAIVLGGTKSGLHLSELMAMVHPCDIPIVKITSCERAVEIFTAKLVAWLFNKYVLVLLKTCCYVTECNFSRWQVKFYLRECWTSASHKMTTHLAEKGALDVLKSSKARATGILRYVPKQNHHLRSLLVMKKSAWSLPKEDSRALNIYLHYIDAKINKSRMYLPTTIQQEWRKFFSEWKANGSPKLYYLRMDIRDAYPSVCLKKLNDILLKAGGERGHKMLLKEYALLGNSTVKRFRKSLFDSRNRNSWHSGIHVRPCIAVDLENDVEISVWKMLEQIATMINTTNVVKVGKKTFQFHYGLPQGWSQSPMLCSIYYGYMDSTLYIPYLEPSGRLFLRIVDDYLFLSPDPSEVANLMQLMKIGCHKYGIKMNADKSDSNIFVRSDSLQPTTNCELITFCGWNFCITCGHVSRDFKKYIGQDFCSTITFKIPANISSPEQFIRLRGTVIVPARVNPILLDPSINCYKRILLTIFEASIMLGFRFYAICRVVYPNLNALKEEERVNVLISSIHLCCSRLAKYVARNAKYHGPVFASQTKAYCGNGEDCCGSQNMPKIVNKTHDSNMISSNTLSLDTIKEAILSIDSLKYTALHGFRLKLGNHSAVFDKVLPQLNNSILKLARKLGDKHCDHIVEVVGSKIPQCFSEILI